MQKQGKHLGWGRGGRIAEAITASERSACQTVTFPSWCCQPAILVGLLTGAGVILQGTGGSWITGNSSSWMRAWLSQGHCVV